MDSVPKFFGFRTGLMTLDPETLPIRGVLGSVNISKIFSKGSKLANRWSVTSWNLVCSDFVKELLPFSHHLLSHNLLKVGPRMQRENMPPCMYV